MKNICILLALLCLPLFGQLPLPYYPNGPSEISNATQLQGIAICTGTPTNTQLLTYSTANGCWQAASGISGNVAGNVTGNVAGNLTGNVTGNLTGTASTGPQLPNWRLALAKVRDGVADAKILFIGDSTTYGMSDTLCTTNVWPGSYPARVWNILASKYTVAPGLTKPPAAVDSPCIDNRWTLGTGWTENAAYGWGGFSSVEGVAGSGNLVFAPNNGATYDSFDVYYTTSTSGLGTLTITATGGSPVVQSTIHSSPIGFQHVTVTAASAATNNTVTITTSVNPVFVDAIEPWLSTVRTVRIGSMGVSGSTSSNWANGFSGYLPSVAIANYAPNLTVINLGINDGYSSVPAATVTANLSNIVTAAQASGDVILVMPNPVSQTPTVTSEALYYPAIQNLANTLNVPLIDIYGRWGQTWQTNLMANSLHPNDYGYWDIAEAITSLLLQVAP